VQSNGNIVVVAVVVDFVAAVVAIFARDAFFIIFLRKIYI
jgi:hypothetical protein